MDIDRNGSGAQDRLEALVREAVREGDPEVDIVRITPAHTRIRVDIDGVKSYIILKEV